ncbi:MAG: hypothetical protein UR15_C0001G0018 [Parcubacteria group bacterium GW2011_GWA2_31_28]|nr:MAG: hypothetical protein UR15_C0001G0018 [Parcubacteria group bacterium GW2011_GWA2_31_28]
MVEKCKSYKEEYLKYYDKIVKSAQTNKLDKDMYVPFVKAISRSMNVEDKK